MEDTEEMETDDVYVMEDDIIAIDESMDTEDTQDFQSSPFASINVEGLFRAGTPTPVVTPPFPQVTMPATHTIPDVIINNDGAVHLLLSLRETDSPGTEMAHTVVSDNLFDGIMEEEINGIDEILELGHEISTEELDTECTFLSDIAEYSLGCTAAELLEFLVTVSLQATATAGCLYLAYWK